MRSYNDVVIVATNPIQAFDAHSGKRFTEFNRGAYEPSQMPDGLLDRVTDRHGTAFWYYDDWNTNFGHYLMDHSHDILQFEALHEKPELICSSAPYVNELLDLRGLCGNGLPCDQVHFFKTILVPEPVCAHGTVLPAAVIKFFNELRDCAPTCTPPVERLLITRQDTQRRVLRNEPELIAGLVRLGFMPYAFGSLPLAARISLVRRARLVFTHSGAGACNHAWIRPGARTITLYNPHLRGEERNNSNLTRVMGGHPVALDENGLAFTNEKNFGKYVDEWELPSVDAILSAVKLWMIAANPGAKPN